MSKNITIHVDMTKPPEYSEEDLKLLEELDKYPIEYDDDCPKLTKEQLAKFKRVKPKVA